MPRPLIDVARRLADLLDRENEALKAMDLRRVASFLPEKTAAIADLMASGDAAFGPSNPPLASITQRLNDLALENRRLLERAIAAQQRVIGIIVGAAAAIAVEPSYGSEGRQERLTGPMALSTRA